MFELHSEVKEKNHAAKSKLFYHSRCEFVPYCLSTQDATFRQYTGAAIIPFVLDIPVAPAFLVIPAFLSFRLSCLSGFPVFPAFLRSFRSLQSK
jgi:hypothetical protein